MMRFTGNIAAVVALAATLAVPAAFAQATRTWVSGVGDDANPCSRTAPCKTWAGAISKTADGGEINALDPGGFGSVTITKSITLNGEGTMASTLASGVPGIIVNAAATDVVILRNLEINGIGNSLNPGTNGLWVLSASQVHLDKVFIYGFSQSGVLFQPGGACKLYISNSSLRDNAGHGLYSQPQATGTAMVTITNSNFEGNGKGIRVDDGTTALVDRTSVSGNSLTGILTYSTLSRSSTLTLDNSSASNNVAAGVRAFANTTIYINNSNVTSNDTGLDTSAGGSIVSWGNNRVVNNGSGNGVPSVTIMAK
jgi:hypothetical protein